MTKFKAGDKIVLEIESVEYKGANVPANYVMTCGIKIPVTRFDPNLGKIVAFDAELLKEDKAGSK